MNTVFAECPACKHSLPVTIGRKSTARVTTCDKCGAVYDYSAWQIAPGSGGGDTVSLWSFYKVELFRQSDAAEAR